MLKKKIPKIILLFFVIDIIFGVIYLFIYKFGDPLPRNILTKLFDLNAEANLPAWYSSMQLLSVGILFGVFSYCNFDKTNFRSWWLVLFPLIFFFLSADEVGQIHERLGHLSDILLPNCSRKETIFRNTGIWMFIIGIPFIGFFIFLLNSIKFYFKDVKGVLTKLIVGITIMLFGALFIESFSNLWKIEAKAHIIEVFFEESCEMIGVTFMLWAAYDLLAKNKFSLSINLSEEKKRTEKIIK